MNTVEHKSSDLACKSHAWAAEVVPAKSTTGNVLIYEYGARLDKECSLLVDEQVRKARRLYNDIVALMRDTVEEMQADLLAKAGQDARDTQARIDALNIDFTAAKAADDEPGMKEIAQQRREAWGTLSAQLKEARKTLKADHQERFFSRIGKKATCATYQLRSQAVADGLGWGTANEILDNALTAFSKSIIQGRAPRFASANEKTQDSLTLQFTVAGGLPVADLLSRTEGDFVLVPPVAVGQRKYGTFQFRLGAAKADTYATGTWQYHRTLPDDSSIGIARLVRRRIGKDTRYAIQLQVKLKDGIEQQLHGRNPLVAVHFGWNGDVSARRVAGIADSADPGQARIITLPTEVEEGLARIAELRGERDSERDKIVPAIKAIDPAGFMPELADEIAAIKRLPVQHVAIRRLHRLCRQLREIGALPAEIEVWRKADRLRWQNETHLAKRSRNRRKDFYRKLAIQLARSYEVIVIEPLDLAKAAKKLDKVTGEKTELAKKARAGRVVAALYELESAIRWAAVKTGAAVLELTASTASVCSVCGAQELATDNENSQILRCLHCGAELDRKKNGAAVAWQIVAPQRETLATDYHTSVIDTRQKLENKKKEGLDKMAQGRRLARTNRQDKMPGSSRTMEPN